ncbi:MAG: hypothetical protein GC201_18880 [Alphaproteobacteria bacterium]|nr:hypothetical protein [Alphaproteobacteria bacterium]
MERALPDSHALQLVYRAPDGSTVSTEIAVPADQVDFGRGANDLLDAMMDPHRRREWLVRMGLSLGYGIADRLDRGM